MADKIAVKEIAGLPVIRCKIRYEQKYIEAHILFDVGLPIPMVIHEKSVGGFELSPRDAVGKEVDIEFGENSRWKGVPMQVAGVGLLEQLTMKYAQELKEVPVVAIVGLSAIKSTVIELDVQKGLLQTMGMASDEASENEMDYKLQSGAIVMDGTGACETPIKFQLVTRTADSYLDTSLLLKARKAKEKPNVLVAGKVQFSDYTAFRFGSLRGGVKGVVGASALRNYKVTIWPERKKISFLPYKEVPFPQAEQDYFFALYDKKPEGVAKFISENRGHRLIDEACQVLWQIRLGDPASTIDKLKESLQTIAANYDSKRRSKLLMTIADNLEQSVHPSKSELLELALKLAMSQSKVSLDPTSIHEVHVRFGRRALERGDLKQARRHLLSAAFGLPKNGECNYWLGELYKEMGKPRRAWSRYFQAILDPRIPEAALKGCLASLDELNRDPEFRKTFSMVVAEQFMAGRLEDAEFHASSRYKQVQKKYPGHVKLVEFFCDSNDPSTGGMQLAFQALDEFFAGDVALIEYHIKDPMHSEASMERLKYYGKTGSPLVVFDGKPLLDHNVSREQKLSDNAAGNYSEFHKGCLYKEPADEQEWFVDAKMEQDGTKVSGTVTVSGEGETDSIRLHVILCELSVMAIESNGVFFHHYVARKSLTPSEGVDLKAALEKPVEFSVDAKQISGELKKMLGMDTFSDDVVDAGLIDMSGDIGQMLNLDSPAKGRSKPTYVDANKLMVVAFVQDAKDNSILAAKTFRLPQEDEVH